MVSVKAYGAKGNYDSVANTGKDDTVAIQNAINAAAASGETLCFPLGKYKVTGALTLNWVRHKLEYPATRIHRQTLLIRWDEVNY